MSNNSNIKLMKSKPTLSDEEIRTHMDFDNLLQLHKQLPTKSILTAKRMTYTAYITSAVLLIGTATYFAWPKKAANGTVDQPSEKQLTVTQDSAARNSEAKTQEAKTDRDEIKLKPNVKTTTKPLAQQSQSKERKEVLSVPVFKEAEPINGYPDLYAYFERELKYPAEAQSANIEGVVSVSFAINKSGKPADIQITNSLGEAFDKECLRVIENMPPWRAATINDAPTTTRLSIPLTFRITNKNQ